MSIQRSELERARLVRRQFFESIRPRVEYSVTDLGRTLRPIYVGVCDWANAHSSDITRNEVRYDESHPRPV